MDVQFNQEQARSLGVSCESVSTPFERKANGTGALGLLVLIFNGEYRLKTDEGAQRSDVSNESSVEMPVASLSDIPSALCLPA